MARTVSLADVLGPGSKRRDGGETYKKCVVVGDGDFEIVAHGVHVPVGSRAVPDTEADDASGLESSRDDENIGQADGTPDVVKRNHLRAGRQVILD